MRLREKDKTGWITVLQWCWRKLAGIDDPKKCLKEPRLKILKVSYSHGYLSCGYMSCKPQPKCHQNIQHAQQPGYQHCKNGSWMPWVYIIAMAYSDKPPVSTIIWLQGVMQIFHWQKLVRGTLMSSLNVIRTMATLSASRSGGFGQLQATTHGSHAVRKTRSDWNPPESSWIHILT